jgi:hypothetical protein
MAVTAFPTWCRARPKRILWFKGFDHQFWPIVLDASTAELEKAAREYLVEVGCDVANGFLAFYRLEEKK